MQHLKTIFIFTLVMKTEVNMTPEQIIDILREAGLHKTVFTFKHYHSDYLLFASNMDGVVEARITVTLRDGFTSDVIAASVRPEQLPFEDIDIFGLSFGTKNDIDLWNPNAIRLNNKYNLLEKVE